MDLLRSGRLAAACAAVALLGSGCAYITQVSVNTDGTQSKDFGASNAPAISADGRYVTFQTGAANLVSGDTNGKDDIFLRDTVSGKTTRVSVATGMAGLEANGASSLPAISGDGRYVAFLSVATNLGVNDSPNRHVFVRDTQAGTTTQVDVNTAGNSANGSTFGFGGAPSISADGQFIAFDSTATNLGGNDTNVGPDVFIRDTVNHKTTLVNAVGTAYSNGGSYAPSISANGRYVAFTSYSSNLVTGDGNGALDVFVRDTVGLTTTRASVTSLGIEGKGASAKPSISADGLHVAFKSIANNLVAGDTNATWDVFRHDLTGQLSTTRVNVSDGGAQSSQTSAEAPPGISADGRYISFDSTDALLVANDTNQASDVFVRDTKIPATTTRASLDGNGAQAMGGVSDYSAISADGHYVAFRSQANNLVPNQLNSVYDVFERANPVPTLISVSPNQPTVTRGTTTTITVNGTHLLPATAVPLYPGVTGYFGADISTVTNRISENQVKFTITVGASAAVGPRIILVFNPGTRGGINPTTTDALSGAAIAFSLTIQ